MIRTLENFVHVVELRHWIRLLMGNRPVTDVAKFICRWMMRGIFGANINYKFGWAQLRSFGNGRTKWYWTQTISGKIFIDKYFTFHVTCLLSVQHNHNRIEFIWSICWRPATATHSRVHVYQRVHDVSCRMGRFSALERFVEFGYSWNVLNTCYPCINRCIANLWGRNSVRLPLHTIRYN